MKRAFSLRIAFVLSAMLPIPITAAEPSGPIAPEIRGFTNWLRITATNYKVSPQLAMMCRAIPTTQIGTAGEHKDIPIAVFINALAASAFTNRTRAEFPKGSIIVKAKYDFKLDSPSELGVMIKRPTGFDPVGGNWEYAFIKLKSNPSVTRGKLQNCRDCHQTKKNRDFVFANFEPKTERP